LDDRSLGYPGKPVSNQARQPGQGQGAIVINISSWGIAAQDHSTKLLAPIEYRGRDTVKTKLEGIYFSELLKQTAQVADKIACSSMTQGSGHDRGTHNMLPLGPVCRQYPSIGSIVSHELGCGMICSDVSFQAPNSFAGPFFGFAYGRCLGRIPRTADSR